MDLGISTLTDDQLVELLQEACAELAQRDPIVRKEAQCRITEEAEKGRLLRERKLALLNNQVAREKMMGEAIEKAILSCRDQQVEEIRLEIAKILEKEVKDGTWKPLNSSQQASAVVDAVKDFDITRKPRKTNNAYTAKQGIPSREETPYSADRTVVDRLERKF